MSNVEETYQPPSRERQERLLAGLGRLCQVRGFETLVRAPTLEPTSEYFPDNWTPTVGGVRRLIKRLMAYAGLDHLDVELEVFDSKAVLQALDESGRPLHENTAAWYAGTKGELCRFGLDVRRAADPVELTGVLCHEVAHAYRDHFGLQAKDREVEEQLTDLTTIFLGFGFFTVSAAFISRSRGWVAGAFAHAEFSVGTTGYLAAGEMAFLLAARAVARGETRKTIAGLRSRLPANQAHAFKLAWDQLAADPSRVRDLLGVPEPEEWPPAPERERVQQLAIEPRPGDERALEPAKNATRAEDIRRPTFRVRRTRSMVGGFAGATLGLVVAAGMLDFGRSGILWAFCAGGALLGVLSCRSWRTDFCSNPACEHRLGLADSHCPGCQRRVAGEIGDRSERLAAEEEWQERQRTAPGEPYRSQQLPLDD